MILLFVCVCYLSLEFSGSSLLSSFLSYFSLLVAITPSSDSKDIKPVNPKGNQSWVFIGRTDAEAEVPILWLPDAKSQLIGKDPDAGKDWRQEKGVTGDEMVGWHHRLNTHKFEQAPGDGKGQRSLVCCSPRGLKELDMTEWLNNNPVPLSCVLVPICPIWWWWLCGSPTFDYFTAACYSLTSFHSHILRLRF